MNKLKQLLERRKAKKTEHAEQANLFQAKPEVTEVTTEVTEETGILDKVVKAVKKKATKKKTTKKATKAKKTK